MKERGILFSAPMVRALLDGSKTQTRRALKAQPPAGTVTVGTWHHPDPRPHFFAYDGAAINGDFAVPCPYGQPGDRLWVRETWQYYDWTEDGEPCIRYAADNATVWPEVRSEAWAEKLVDIWEVLSHPDNYDIDNRAADRCWRPSIFLPRWGSRILLETTGVRVERLHAISRGDAMDEGCPFPNMAKGDDPRRWYAELWNSINGAGSWDANPWVWVIEFKRVTP